MPLKFIYATIPTFLEQRGGGVVFGAASCLFQRLEIYGAKCGCFLGQCSLCDMFGFHVWFVPVFIKLHYCIRPQLVKTRAYMVFCNLMMLACICSRVCSFIEMALR